MDQKKAYFIKICIADISFSMRLPDGTKEEKDLYESSYRKAGRQINEFIKECKSAKKIDDKTAMAMCYLNSLQALEIEEIKTADAIKELQKKKKKLKVAL